jgi:hypothetical protein
VPSAVLSQVSFDHLVGELDFGCRLIALYLGLVV